LQKRNLISILAVGTILVLPVFGQNETVPPGWKTCPRCLSSEQQKNEVKFNPLGMPFNPRDLGGVWHAAVPVASDSGLQTNVLDTTSSTFAKQLPASGVPPANVPSLTAYGKQLFDATLTDFKSPEGTALTNSNDPMLRCDPLGWPRWFTLNYGIEFVVLPDRVIQFIESGHTHRTIWTDGRKVPDNPPETRFMGWAVGHWEADNTFVVESNGYDERTWISEAGNFVTTPGAKGWGLNAWPHSDEMRIVERWKRTNYGILEAQITIIDPKVYTKPWTSEVVRHMLLPDTELWENFCVPSDSNYFNQKVVVPLNRAK
jgi:hypothetical protein